MINELRNGEVGLYESDTKAVLMPIKFQLQKYLESKGVFSGILTRLAEISESDLNSNFVCGDVWKQKSEHFNEKIVIPIFLYFDDMEVNNPLGPHTAAVCAAYYTIPIIPQANLSHLNHIFVAALIKTSDLKQYGNESFLYPLIEVFKDLYENGILLTIDGKQVKVYFLLGQILGDNLALNGLLGFPKSFNADYFCRNCFLKRNVCQQIVSEDREALRNATNYSDHLQNNSCGVIENSIFNTMPLYHVTQNFAFDILHDFFEGICGYDLAEILFYFIYKKKYFTLTQFNNNKKLVNSHGKNLGIAITEDRLKQKKLKFTASEMKALIHFFPFIVGSYVPEDDEVWKFFLILLKMIDLILKPTITESDLIMLRDLIESHNSSFQTLFQAHLKPKFHFLTHYVTAIEKCGPIKHMWTMRFEAKHKELKAYAENMNSRVNVCLSIAKKFSLKFSYTIFGENALYIPEVTYEIKDTKEFQCKSYFDAIKTNLVDFDGSSMASTLSNCIISGQQYKIDDVIEIKGLLVQITDFVLLSDTVYFIVEEFDTNSNNHLGSTELMKINGNTHIILYKEVHTPPLPKIIYFNKTYVRLEHF